MDDASQRASRRASGIAVLLMSWLHQTTVKRGTEILNVGHKKRDWFSSKQKKERKESGAKKEVVSGTAQHFAPSTDVHKIGPA